MQKDFKIGLIVGLVLMGVAIIWVSTRTSLSSKARLERAQDNSSPASAPQTEPVFTPTEPPAATNDGPVQVASLSPGLPPEPDPQVSHPGPPQLPTIPPADTVITTEEPERLPIEAEEKIKTNRFHIVQEGDSLSSISKTYYGSATKWQKIMNANTEVVKDPRRIRPGMKLIIPE